MRYKGTFVIGESSLSFGMCPSVPFAAKGPVFANFPGKFYLLFLAFLYMHNFWNVRCLFWNKNYVCWGKGGVLTKTTEKSCKIQFATMELKSSWQQSVQELIKKLHLLKCLFLLEKKFNFLRRENANIFRNTKNLTTGTVLQSNCRVTKIPFSGKTPTSFNRLWIRL